MFFLFSFLCLPGYVKGSTEDLRYIRNTPVREDSFIRGDSGEEEKLYKDPLGKYNASVIQRDDSAYVSSSTYFTEPRSPKSMPLCTPDSGIRSPSPEPYDPAELVQRPTVPQRKREKKMRIIETTREFERTPSPPPATRREPEPDYSPSHLHSHRSRSISPVPLPSGGVNGNGGHHYRSNPKKMYQKTRFASSSELSRPISTHTIETQTTPIKKPTVGATISNSIRKLVGKIRSASVDRKSKSKAKRSLSPVSHGGSNGTSKHQSAKQQHQHNHHNSHHQQQQQPFNRAHGDSTYQQYNVIDNHIGQQSFSTATPSSNRESSIVSSRREPQHQHRRNFADTHHNNNNSNHGTMATTTTTTVSATNGVAKPKYYLGEDPYLSALMPGAEKKYDGTQRAQRYQSRRQRSDIDVYNQNRYVHSACICILFTLYRCGSVS